MIKRLLNPHILLKITLILTTLLLLPTSSWAIDYQTTTLTNSNQSGNSKYYWAVNGTSKQWTAISGSTINPQSTGFTVTLNSANKTLEIKGMESPVACRINKIKISTSYDTSKCSLAVKVGNDTFNSTSTTGEFVPSQSNYEWNSNSISITYTNTSSGDVTITVNSITLQLCVDDASTNFSWQDTYPTGVTNPEGTIIADIAYGLEFTYALQNTSGRSITYSSNDESVATVNNNGVVTIMSKGNATITATFSANDDYYYSSPKTYTYNLKTKFSAPTISPNGGTQSLGESISISYPDVDVQPTIKYKWDSGNEFVYSENVPSVKTGDLTAWGEVESSGKTLISDEETTSFIASYGISIGETFVTTENAGNIFKDDPTNNGKVRYNQETNTLTLNGATISSNISSSLETLTISFQGTNTINGSISQKNETQGTLSFTGDGSLTIDNPISGAAIYNFTSVDFGGFNLATTSSPGIFYIVNEPMGNPNQLWSYNIYGHATNVTLTKKTTYPLWIGTHTSSSYQTFTQVTEDNYPDILGNGNISFDKDHTLTLNGASITGSIISGLSSLNIVVDKANSIQFTEDSATCIRNIKPGATLTLQKKQNSEMASLIVQGGHFIRDFKSISYSEGGLNLSAYYRTAQDSNPVDLLISDAHYDYELNDFRTSSNNGISYVKFSNENPPFLVMIGNTPITTTPTTINASGNNDLLGDEGSVTLSVDDKGNNILTIDNTSTNGKDIFSTLPNLTIKYKGSCQIGKIISTYSNAALTFGLAEGAGDNASLCWSFGKSILPWQGFSATPTFNDNLCYLPDDDSQYIQKLPAPQFSMDGSELYFSLSGNHLDQMHIFYSVDFVKGDDVELEEYNHNKPQTIDKPCTITAYTEFEDMFNIKRHSDTVTGKYFGFETEKLTVPYQASVNAPAVFPTLPSGVTKIFSNAGGLDIVPNTIDSETGVVTITELTQGDPFVYQATFSAPQNINYTVLNDAYSFNNSNPEAPIVESYYLGTFSVAVTKKSLNDVTIEDIPDQTYTGSPITPTIVIKNGEILLTDDDCEIAYSNNTSVGTATVTVTPTETSYYSDSATKTFTITAKSLADATVTLADDKTEFTYYEASNVPNITRVYLTEGTETPATTIDLTAGTDYTISYVKVNGETEEAIEASNIINVGSYKMILTGKGNFSGTKAIPFTITPRAITNLSFSLSATSFTYNGEAQKPTVTVQFEETELEATKGTIKTIPTTDYDLTFSGECINAGTYSVSASLKGNYSGSGNGPSFTINKAPISPKVTLAGWTYGATANTPSVSGNTGNGEVTYAYKLQNEAESAFAAAAPTNAGAYTVKASIAATANYEAASDTAHFTIAKDDITPTVTIEGWTYGSTPNKPEVKGNTGNGAESFTYKAGGTDVFTSEVPTAVGTHTVKVTIAETANYNGGEATATFTIINRTIDAANDIAFAEGQTYASFYSSDEDLELPETGIAVYMITGIEGNTLITQAVSYIPKATPVLIEKTETAVEVKDPSEVGTNLLQYATEDVTTDGTLYILYNGEYVKATGTIPQGKCYLKSIKPSGSRRLAIGHNNGTTGISNFDAETGTDRWYDLNGQRISKPQKKGVYINNGRKIVVK